MNTQRRIFRGRGGPTDRRLPKYNARRAKPPPQAKKSSNTDNHHQNEEEEQEDYIIGETIVPGEEEDENEFQLEIVQPSDMQSAESSTSDDVDLHRAYNDASPYNDTVPSAAILVENPNSKANEPTVDPTVISPCQKELKHLHRRINNIREAMQLSQSSADPKIYQENILNAVANCVNEWRQIKNHYSTNNQEGEEEELSEEKIKEVSLNVFQLIQHSVQCGPLQGGKPGYFKRCGSLIAKIVLDYLLVIVPNKEASQFLGFSEKQVNALESWKSNAEKAVANDKPPSKSQLKKQTEASKKSQKAKKKKG